MRGFRQKFLKGLGLVLGVALVVALGMALRVESDFFVLKSPTIEVEFFDEQQALVQWLKPELEKQLSALAGSNIFRISLKDVRQNLLKNPWIADVELHRRFPGQLSTLFRLKPMAFLYLDSKNRPHPVTEIGEVLDTAPPLTVLPGAPILRNQKVMNDETQRRQVVELLNQVPNIGPLRRDNISEIDWNSVTGLELQLIAQDATVYLGQLDITTKGLQVLRVIDYLESQKLKARVIDASFSKKVLVRPRKRS